MESHHINRRIKKGVTICIILETITLLALFNPVSSATEDGILKRYTPVAMDESWAVVKDHNKLNSNWSKHSGLNSLKPNFLDPIDNPELDSPVDSPADPLAENNRFQSQRDRPFMNNLNEIKTLETENLTDVEDSQYKNISENLFRLPEKTTPALTKLITGKEKVTLVQDKVVRPVGSVTINNTPEHTSKVLAQYEVLIPIYVPALKPYFRAQKSETSNISYVKETHTKMVPVKKNVKKVKEIVRAERVPQQIITDYVKADGAGVPSTVTDKVMPNEKILKSVVTNFE